MRRGRYAACAAPIASGVICINKSHLKICLEETFPLIYISSITSSLFLCITQNASKIPKMLLSLSYFLQLQLLGRPR